MHVSCLLTTVSLFALLVGGGASAALTVSSEEWQSTYDKSTGYPSKSVFLDNLVQTMKENGTPRATQITTAGIKVTYYRLEMIRWRFQSSNDSALNEWNEWMSQKNAKSLIFAASLREYHATYAPSSVSSVQWQAVFTKTTGYQSSEADFKSNAVSAMNKDGCTPIATGEVYVVYFNIDDTVFKYDKENPYTVKWKYAGKTSDVRDEWNEWARTKALKSLQLKSVHEVGVTDAPAPKMERPDDTGHLFFLPVLGFIVLGIPLSLFGCWCRKKKVAEVVKAREEYLAQHGAGSPMQTLGGGLNGQSTWTGQHAQQPQPASNTVATTDVYGHSPEASASADPWGSNAWKS